MTPVFRIPAALASAAVFLAGLLGSPAWAKSVCKPAARAPEVAFVIKPGKVKVVNTLSRQQLQRMKRQGSTLTPVKGWNPVGLTSTELGFSMSLRVNAVPRKKGSYCGFLESVRASVGYDELTVYVARKYRPGSCHYQSIMDHENLHVLVFRRTLEQYGQRINHRLKSAAIRMRPVLAGNAKEAAASLKAKLRRKIQPLFKEMNRELNRANAKLDTPHNYKREQARCRNW